MNKPIGVTIITHNRPEFLKKILVTIPDYVDLFVVNTGNAYDESVYDCNKNIKGIHQCPKKTCVGHGKNLALKRMLENGNKHLFTMEDDVYIKDPMVFNNYIKAAHETGIWHLNFGFSQRENLDKQGNPAIRMQVNFHNDVSIVLTPNILGAFTYFLAGVLKAVGLHNEGFNHNHMDHVDLTLRIIKNGLHPAFWWFADINKSWEMIGNLSNMSDDSIVRNEDERRKYFIDACMLFKELHGFIPTEHPPTHEAIVIQQLKDIHSKYRKEYNP